MISFVINIFNFITMHIELVLSMIALIISLTDLIYLIYTNFKRLDINVIYYSRLYIHGKNYYMINIEFINKSRQPIAVNEIVIKYENSDYKIIKSPRLLLEKNRTKGKVLTDYKELSSAKFPINLAGLSSEQKFVVMYGPDSLENTTSKISLSTNRGKISNKLNLKDYYVSIDDFKKDALEYTE